MAIVASGVVTKEGPARGAKWRMHDNEYINNTPEKNKALQRDASQNAFNILVQRAREEHEQRSKEQCRELQG